MSSPTVTHSFTNGTTSDATQVNTNFSDLIASMTDGNDDFAINALTLSGALTANGNCTFGNAGSDDLTFTGSLASSIPVKTTNSYDIGVATIGLQSVYFGSSAGAFSTRLIGGAAASSYTITLPTAVGAAGDHVETTAAGVLSFSGGPVSVNKTTTYTATTADKVITADTSGGAWTLTLYAASGNGGRTLLVKKTTADVLLLTIDGNASETIDGATTKVLAYQYDSVLIYCDGSNWHIAEEVRAKVAVALTSYDNTTLATGAATYLGGMTKSVDSHSLATTGSTSTTAGTADLITVPTLDLWGVTAKIEMNPTTNWGALEALILEVTVSGTAQMYAATILQAAPGSIAVSAYLPQRTLSVGAGGTIQIRVTQTTGSNLTVSATSARTYLNVERL